MNPFEPSQRAKYYKELKLKKARERKLKTYNKYKENYNSQKKQKRGQTEEWHACTKSAIRKRKSRLNQIQKAEKQREYQRRYREKKKENENISPLNSQFKNRMEKCRQLKKMKATLPQTPGNRYSIIDSYIASSPGCKRTLFPAKDSNDSNLDSSVVENVKAIVISAKKKRTNDARAAMNILSASVTGTPHHSQAKLAKRLGIRKSRVRGGFKRRTAIFESDNACYTETKRQVRRDSISEDTKRLVYEWWISPENSRPTGNKSDIKKKRVGFKTYVSHQLHVLEKPQIEVYSAFKERHPEIKIGQRMFEKLRPFFVRQMRIKDRNTCCCRKHVEFRLLFRRCMSCMTSERYTHISEIVDATLCPKPDDTEYYRRQCIERTCDDCGVGRISNAILEDLEPSTVNSITWECYEYVEVQSKNGKKKKLTLVKKQTPLREMFNYFFKLLHDFPAHQFRASWQNEQLNSLKTTLPEKHCLVIHDFSENYKCIEKNEIQSSYFSKPEVSIHVSVIYRHAVPTIENTGDIVSEVFYTVSPDQIHDQYFVALVQKEIKTYLTEKGCDVETMHEFTDGCPAQYKSRHCMGMSSYATQTLGYKTFIRNYFETSHAKGPQDAAGGMLKRQLDIAVMKGKIIQSAWDVYEYASEHLSTPKSGIYQARVFKYIDSVDRSSRVAYKPIPQIRSIHQITQVNPGTLKAKDLSCYTCDSCLSGGSSECDNVNLTGPGRTITVRRDDKMNSFVNDPDAATEDDSIDAVVHTDNIVAVLAEDDEQDYFVLKVMFTTIYSRIPIIRSFRG